MKKLVEVILAPQDTGVLFNSNNGRMSNSGIINLIEKDCYSELMRGDGANEREGVIIYATKKEYEEFQKQKRID